MSVDIRNRSLFDVEDMDDMPRVRDMTVSPVPNLDIQEFARRYHYTGVAMNNLWRWGLWSESTLLGVVAYNLPTRSVCASVFGEEHHANVWHMGRLMVADHVPRNAESRLIGGSLQAIHRDHPHVWAVLTYAATDVGHIGYVYQATNAIYTGAAGHARFYIDPSGRRRSDYLSGWVSPKRASEMGWIAQDGQVKHRYVYILGSRTQRKQRRRLLRYPVLPYPKENRMTGNGDKPSKPINDEPVKNPRR